jgi:MFS superfamily sulfate permease-like transporter
MATVISAGQWVSLAVLLMSVTGVLRFATQRVPVPVVKGIQLGAGLSLVMTAGSSLLVKLHWTHPSVDNRLWALAAFLVLIATQSLRRFPYALCIFVISLVLAAVSILTHEDGSRLPWFHIWHPSFSTSLNWFSTTPISMAIGQLPLTTLNSVIAVSALSSDLLPDMPTPSVTSLGISVGMMNLIGGWFGAMPVCHGAGGLAAQFRFGARSGSSIIMLGIFKILLGLFFGGTLIDLLSHYPKSLLGIMVVAAGLELAKVGNSLNQGAPDLLELSVQDGDGTARRHRDTSEEERARRWTVMLMTTAGILAFRNDAVGFMAGMLCHAAYRLSDAVAEWYRSRQGRLGETVPLLR